jgi:uncharacterized OB-fold protein
MIDYDDWGDKPLPVIDAESEPYWSGANEGDLVVQRCEECGERQFYPRDMCRHCWSEDVQFERTNGTGTVYAKTICHVPGQSGYGSETPYNIALVNVGIPDDNPSGYDIRLLTHVDCPNEQVETGMAVTVEFRRISEDPAVQLPVFVPAASD